jgi:hypothetical protein
MYASILPHQLGLPVESTDLFRIDPLHISRRAIDDIQVSLKKGTSAIQETPPRGAVADPVAQFDDDKAEHRLR